MSSESSKDSLSNDPQLPGAYEKRMEDFNFMKGEKGVANSCKYLQQTSATVPSYGDNWNKKDLDRMRCGGINDWSTDNPLVFKAAKFAINHFNKDMEKKLQLKKVMRAHGKVCSKMDFYLTLLASDENYYESHVRVRRNAVGEEKKFGAEVIFVRLAYLNPNLLRQD